MTDSAEKLEAWVIVELFGHQRIAGKLTEQQIGGGNMIRIDVPETKSQPGFTRFLGNAAIYAINPVSEQIARAAAENLNAAPVRAYDIPELAQRQLQYQEEDEFE